MTQNLSFNPWNATLVKTKNFFSFLQKKGNSNWKSDWFNSVWKKKISKGKSHFANPTKTFTPDDSFTTLEMSSTSASQNTHAILLTRIPRVTLEILGILFRPLLQSIKPSLCVCGCFFSLPHNLPSFEFFCFIRKWEGRGGRVFACMVKYLGPATRRGFEFFLFISFFKKVNDVERSSRGYKE